MRKPASSSDACTSHAAIESRLAARSATPTGKVMTFETARMRTESETLLGNELQLTQAMRALSAVVGVAQSATAVIPRIDCRILRW